jgi:hypothetical protein
LDENPIDDFWDPDYLDARSNREAQKLYGSIKRGRRGLTANAPLLFWSCLLVAQHTLPNPKIAIHVSNRGSRRSVPLQASVKR